LSKQAYSVEPGEFPELGMHQTILVSSTRQLRQTIDQQTPQRQCPRHDFEALPIRVQSYLLQLDQRRKEAGPSWIAGRLLVEQNLPLDEESSEMDSSKATSKKCDRNRVSEEHCEKTKPRDFQLSRIARKGSLAADTTIDDHCAKPVSNAFKRYSN
jgi:hypothetical protein